MCAAYVPTQSHPVNKWQFVDPLVSLFLLRSPISKNKENDLMISWTIYKLDDRFTKRDALKQEHEKIWRQSLINGILMLL